MIVHILKNGKRVKDIKGHRVVLPEYHETALRIKEEPKKVEERSSNERSS